MGLTLTSIPISLRTKRTAVHGGESFDSYKSKDMFRLLLIRVKAKVDKSHSFYLFSQVSLTNETSEHMPRIDRLQGSNSKEHVYLLNMIQGRCVVIHISRDLVRRLIPVRLLKTDR